MDHYGGMIINRGAIKISLLYDNPAMKVKCNGIHKDVPPKLKCPVCGESYQFEKLGHPRSGCVFRTWFFGRGHFLRCAEALCPRCAGRVFRELKDDRCLVDIDNREAKKRGWIF